MCYKATQSNAECVATKQKFLGQPTSETHPHILNIGEITPSITKTEYQNRRLSLVELILKKETSQNHLVRPFFVYV